MTTPQGLFNACAYALLTEGTCAKEVTAAYPSHSLASHRFLLRDLQQVHDNYTPELWGVQLDRIAKAYNLEPSHASPTTARSV